MSDFHVTKEGREAKWLIYQLSHSWAVHAPLIGREHEPMAPVALFDTHTECVAYMLNNDVRRCGTPVTTGALNANSALAAEGFCPPLAGIIRPPF